MGGSAFPPKVTILDLTILLSALMPTQFIDGMRGIKNGEP